MLELGAALACLGSAGLFHRAREAERARPLVMVGAAVAFCVGLILSHRFDPGGLTIWVEPILWWLVGLTAAVLVRPVSRPMADRASLVCAGLGVAVLFGAWGGIFGA